mmetsp:Transcript_157982/g.383644  ORF Transcript_157982/g.383644 Transcript_157982/m.383644 type:complete len:228 (+) Transcript_157982:74-757(+)
MPWPQDRKSESESTTTQAALLKGRGDLKTTKMCWKADLPDTSSVHVRASPIERFGFRLKQGAAVASKGLSVRGIADAYFGRDTPIVEYNVRQERGKQPLLKIKPGDRISAVNSTETYDEMVRELHRASDSEAGLSILLERDLSDVLQAPKQSCAEGSASPKKSGMRKSMSAGALGAVARRSMEMPSSRLLFSPSSSRETDDDESSDRWPHSPASTTSSLSFQGSVFS